MKKYVYFTFAWIFGFEVEFYHLYRINSTGLKSYRRDKRGNPQFETYAGTRFVLREK